MALMLLQSLNAGGQAAGTGSQDHRIGRVFPAGGLHHQRFGVVQPHYLRRYEFRSDRLRAGDSPPVQLHPAQGLFQPIVILDLFRLLQRARSHADDGGIYPCPRRVQGGGNSGRAGADNHDLCHNGSLLWGRFLPANWCSRRAAGPAHPGFAGPPRLRRGLRPAGGGAGPSLPPCRHLMGIVTNLPAVCKRHRGFFCRYRRILLQILQ